MDDAIKGDAKRQHGAYYTRGNPFETRPFLEWAGQAGLKDATVLEPFAGSNNIVSMLQESGLCSRFDCFDISPAGGEEGGRGRTGKSDRGNNSNSSSSSENGAQAPPPGGTGGGVMGRASPPVTITRRDTLRSFPSGYDICITNPPWLARNSARRRGLDFGAIPKKYDDMYKYALDLALRNCPYAAFIIPATFLRSGLFRGRLESFVLLERAMFADTTNPVCLALFAPAPRRAKVWAGDRLLGWLDSLEKKYDVQSGAASASAVFGRRMRFNAPGGMLGLCGVDDTKKDSIRFCPGEELSHRTVKHTDRAIARIDPGVPVTGHMIRELNRMLGEFREETHDVFLAPFKGLRKDGRYRRRLDFATARGLISRYLRENPGTGL